MSVGVESQRWSSDLALLSETEDLLGALIGRVVGLDVARVFEALEGGVHLTDIERPDVSGALFELLTELEPVLGTFAQKRQQRMADAHRSTFTLWHTSARTIRCMLHRIVELSTWHSEVEIDFGGLQREMLNGPGDNFEQVRAPDVRAGMDGTMQNLVRMAAR